MVRYAHLCEVILTDRGLRDRVAKPMPLKPPKRYLIFTFEEGLRLEDVNIFGFLK